MSDLAGKDYFTVPEAAEYAGISVSHWRGRIQKRFPPGRFFGKLIYRRINVEREFGIDYRAVRRLDADRRRRHANPEKYTVRRAERRVTELRQMPPWADKKKIALVYAQCAQLTRDTGVKHHVDHELPLRGRLISGLHVHDNLQILTAIQNLSKGNR